MKSWMMMAAGFLLTGPALADQCAVLVQAQAAKLEALVKAGFGVPALLSYCAPCGDAKATQLPLEELDAADVADFTTFRVGSNEYDAAYVYVPKEKAAPYSAAPSLASLIDCPVTPDTPTAIDVDGAGKVRAVPRS